MQTGGLWRELQTARAGLPATASRRAPRDGREGFSRHPRRPLSADRPSDRPTDRPPSLSRIRSHPPSASFQLKCPHRASPPPRLLHIRHRRFSQACTYRSPGRRARCPRLRRLYIECPNFHGDGRSAPPPFPSVVLFLRVFSLNRMKTE